MTPRARLAVVTVAYNSGDTLERGITATLACAEVDALLLVDNASRDGSIEALLTRTRDPRLRIVRNDTNLGFAVGCNRGAAAVDSELLLFLNPDCFLTPQVLSTLLAAHAAHPDAGVLGALLVDADGKPQRANFRRDPTPWRAFATASGLARLDRWRADGVEMPSCDRGVVEVDACAGALMLVPRAVFDAVHGFDEGYFLHCEDLDLCRRVRAQGHAVKVVCDARVVHLQGSSSRRTPLRVAWHKHRGMLRYFRKFDRARSGIVVGALVSAGAWLRFVAQLPLRLFRR